jgi:hypothetical protein
MRRFDILFLLIVGIALLGLPQKGRACACGCNVFSVGNKWMMATSIGYRMSLQYNYMNQHNNWNGWNIAASDSNRDKEIRSSFTTFGLQYTPTREWGIMVEIPVWNRYLKTTDETNTIVYANHIALADVRVLGMYTGISEDMSTALLFGLKLPTGPFNSSLLDRDTQIGTGTTDLLLGAYQMGQGDGWGWSTQALWQHASNTRDGYRPGDNLDINIAVHYDKLAQYSKFVPFLQVIASFRSADNGPNADVDNTGYQRLYLSPGLEINVSRMVNIYGDFRIPLLTKVSGYQLVAPSLLNITVSYNV